MIVAVVNGNKLNISVSWACPTFVTITELLCGNGLPIKLTDEQKVISEKQRSSRN